MALLTRSLRELRFMRRVSVNPTESEADTDGDCASNLQRALADFESRGRTVALFVSEVHDEGYDRHDCL